MSNTDVCKNIAEIIRDYRSGEFGRYDSSHVEKWISQFDEDEQEIVLLETLKILKRNYITRENFSQFVDALIDSDSVYKSEKDIYWKNVSLLNIQKNGNSQNELNNVLAEKINSLYQVDNLIGKKSDEFIYLDDFIFSGNRLFTDMQDWIANYAPDECRVCIITIGWFVYGQWSTENKLKKIAKELNKNIKFVFVSFPEFRLENRLYRKDYSEVLWPTNQITSLAGYDDWFNAESFNPKYREKNSTKNEIFSSTRREQYEQIMFKYGLKIMGFSSQNSSVVKPLGYSTFRGFGFGAAVFSFRNCPNNNPLVFWWGDPEAASSHPFSKWYPLLQRKTYGS